MASRSISFDENGIRVLDAEKFDDSKQMADECKSFVDSECHPACGLFANWPDAQSSRTSMIRLPRWSMPWTPSHRISRARR